MICSGSVSFLLLFLLHLCEACCWLPFRRKNIQINCCHCIYTSSFYPFLFDQFVLHWTEHRFWGLGTTCVSFYCILAQLDILKINLPNGNTPIFDLVYFTKSWWKHFFRITRSTTGCCHLHKPQKRIQAVVFNDLSHDQTYSCRILIEFLKWWKHRNRKIVFFLFCFFLHDPFKWFRK